MSNFVSGSLWAILLRWSIRAIGLVSTLILARLLTPADFGLVAMGTLIMGLLAVFSELGTWQLLIRMKDPGREHYDTAWTLVLIQANLLAVILFLSAPLAATYFNEPRVTEVIRWLALSSVIAGFNNIGIIKFRKELKFSKDFKFEFLLKFSAFVITVSLAFYLRSYWALVYAVIAGATMGVILSYVMHPFRPRLSLSAWREFLSFSLWMTPAGIADFINNKADVFVVGFAATTAQMGIYNVASELSRMATSEVIVPMGRALYPNYATLRDKPEMLAKAFLNTVQTSSIIAFSFGVGIALVAEDLIYVVLGDQWLDATALMRWLAIFGTVASLSYVLSAHIFIVTQKERYTFMLSWVRALLFVPSVILGSYLGGLEAIAIAAVASTTCFLIIAMFVIQLAVPIKPHQVLGTMVRPIVSAIIMAFVILQIDLNTGIHLVDLLTNAAIGAVTYITALLSMWYIVGCPVGPEKYVTDKLLHRFSVRFQGPAR